MSVLFVFSGLVASAQTWLAEVEGIEASKGQVIVSYLRSPAERPSVLRASSLSLAELERGAVIRLKMDRYEGEWWLDGWWPVSREVAKLIRDDRWWQLFDLAPGGPFEGVLGLDEKGQLVDLRAEAYRFGVIIVPFSYALSETALPLAVERMTQFAERLGVTPHRDLPVILWSLQPDLDSFPAISVWKSALGEAGDGFTWVSGFGELHDSWLERLSVVTFEVERQPMVTNMMLLALDGQNQEIMRYEGDRWPLESLVSRLDEALLTAPRE